MEKATLRVSLTERVVQDFKEVISNPENEYYGLNFNQAIEDLIVDKILEFNIQKRYS